MSKKNKKEYEKSDELTPSQNEQEEKEEQQNEQEESEQQDEQEAKEQQEEQKEQEEQQPEQPAPDPKDEEIANLKDQLLRTMAEYDNYRKRAAKERLELTPEITARTLTEFLPVMDSLEHALNAQCTDPNYKKGVELIRENFVTALTNLGVEEIKSDGEPFDPSFHQAVQQVEKEDAESGTVAATFQKGYKIGDKILRFAMVSVVK